MNNIVLITIDALRNDFSNHLKKTSRFFSKNGKIYNNTFSTASWTPLSFKSIFQSIYPSINLSTFKLGNIPTFVEILKKIGYETIAIPQTPWLSKSFGYDRGFNIFENFKGDFARKEGIAQKIYYKYIEKNPTLWSFAYYFYLNNIVNRDEEILSILNRKINNIDNNRPIFIWVHYMTTHDPHYNSKKFLKSIQGLYKYKKYITSNVDLDSIFTNKDLENFKKNYIEDINKLDDLIHNFIFNMSQKLGNNNTNFILTSDHGQAFGEHGIFTHGIQLYDELINVPLMISGEEVLEDKNNNRLISLLDIPITILNLAEVSYSDIPIFYQGKNILKDYNRNYVISEEMKENIQIGSENVQNPTWKIDQLKISIRNKDWKYILNQKTGEKELYYINEDKNEENNLLNEFPEVERAFNKKIRKHLNRLKNLNTLV